jgi:hypothetical protein
VAPRSSTNLRRPPFKRRRNAVVACDYIHSFLRNDDHDDDDVCLCLSPRPAGNNRRVAGHSIVDDYLCALSRRAAPSACWPDCPSGATRAGVSVSLRVRLCCVYQNRKRPALVARQNDGRPMTGLSTQTRPTLGVVSPAEGANKRRLDAGSIPSFQVGPGPSPTGSGGVARIGNWLQCNNAAEMKHVHFFCKASYSDGYRSCTCVAGSQSLSCSSSSLAHDVTQGRESLTLLVVINS